MSDLYVVNQLYRTKYLGFYQMWNVEQFPILEQFV